MAATIIMTTVSTGEEADALAGGLLAGRLAACIQRIPITSTYRWRDEVRTEEEILLLIKTTAERTAGARAHLEAQHPYDVPEVLEVEARAAGPYLAWLETETAPEPTG